MFASPNPVAVTEQAKLYATYVGQATAMGSAASVSMTPSVGTAKGYRHLLVIVAGSAARGGANTAVTNTVTINGSSMTEIAGWRTADDYSAQVQAHFQVFYTNAVTTGTTATVDMTGTLSGGNYYSKHCAIYEVNRKPQLVGEAKWKGGATAADQTLSPTYASGCLLIGWGSVLENHGTIDISGYEYLASSIGVTSPANSSQCSIINPTYFNGASGWRVQNYAGTNLSTSYGRSYVGLDYPAGRQGYAVTLA